MTRRTVGVAVFIALGWVAAMPAAARAQSTIGGTVKDTSGAVLPGVTVEVSSDVLIEKTKVATTDGGGQYRVVDLRPGMYSIKFSLTGFATVERAAFQLLSEFNARIDADMKVGAMEETITVTGAAPIVDVQSSAHVAVLDRDALDNVPTSRSIYGIGQLVLGVTLSAPDIGGSANAMSRYMSMRGGSVSSANNTVMVDGMVINGLQSNGAVQTYINDADFQEMSYQTAGIGAERSGGGVTLNMVPREGGNRFSGTGMGFYRPGQLQGDNYSERFKLWGLPVDKNGNAAINRIDHVSDMTGSEGGPIIKDKLWFFVSGRAQAPVNTVPNTFLDDGSQGLDDNYIRQSLLRLTYQLSPRHKVGGYYERVYKYRGHDMGAFADPETTAGVWTSPNYSTAAAKYTGTLSNRLLVEGGYSQNVEFYRVLSQPGVDKARGTPEWLSTASHTSTGGSIGVARAGTTMSYPVSQVLQGSVSYVTGSHHAKVGAAWKFGKYEHGADANADLSQGYPQFARIEAENYNIYFPTSSLSDADFAKYFPLLTGRPCSLGYTGGPGCSVTIRNTPRLSGENLNHDLGIFVQDSITLKRLTVTAGIRYETLNAQVDQFSVEGGRFVPARTAPEVKNLPDWQDWAPRIQVVYDLFGDSKTAIKYSFNRYNEATTTGVADNFNGITAATSSRNWTDLNGDDIAQGVRIWSADGTSFTDCVYLTPGCEINLSGTASQPALSPTFGLVSDAGTYTGFPRRSRLEQGLEIQHALMPRLSLSGTYYHGVNSNLTKTINTLRTDDGTKGTQYKKMTLFNPIDGTPYEYYNQTVGAFAGSGNVSYLEPLRTSEYESYSGEFQMRPYAGSQLSGGITFERTLSKDCATSFAGAIVDPNSLRFCDERNMVAFEGGPRIGKPYNKAFKLSGTFPLPYGINFGLSYQNLDSGGINPTFLVGSAFKYPDGTSTYKMLGSSAVLPACPTTSGCTPGAVTVPAGFVGSSAGTSIGGTGTPSMFGNSIPDERIAQLDVKASKNFRINAGRLGTISIQPAIEGFNLLNIDQVRSRAVVAWADKSGNYLGPNDMLQGRILGFGANVKW